MRRKEQLIDHGLIKLFLFALVMLTPFTAWAQTTYNLWIGDIQVTSENASHILGEGNETVTFSVTGSTTAIYTLTLNGAELTAPIKVGTMNLNIDIKGTNTITTSENCLQKLDANSNPSLTFKSTSTPVGSLTLTTTGEESEVSEIGEGQITISKELAPILPHSGNPGGYSSNMYWFTDALKEARFVPSYGVKVGDVYVFADNATDVFDDGTVRFDKTSSTLTLNSASSISNISTTLSTLNIELVGSNSLFRGSNGSIFDSLSGDAVTINLKSTGTTKGSLKMETESNTSAQFKSENVTLTAVNPVVLLSGDLEANSGTRVYGVGYGLSIAGTEVTSENASSVLGNDFKSVSYDPTSSTLTLKGANFTGVISVGESFEELKVHLVGYNWIGTSDCVFDKAATTKLTFTTSTTFPGSLHLNSALPADNIFYENGLSYNVDDKVIEKNLNNTTVTPFTGYVGYVDNEGSNAFIYSGNPDFFASYATAPIARSVLVSPKGENTYLSMWTTNFSNRSLINNIMVQFDWGTCTNTNVTVQVRGMSYDAQTYSYVFDGKTYSEAISLSTADADGIVEIPLTKAITSENFELYFSSEAGFSFYPMNFAFTLVDSYGIEVGDVLISELNSTDVLGDGKVSYVPSTSTLTLKGASITGKIFVYEGPLNVSLSGNNILNGDNETDYAFVTEVGGALNFVTDESDPGQLLMKGYTETCIQNNLTDSYANGLSYNIENGAMAIATLPSMSPESGVYWPTQKISVTDGAGYMLSDQYYPKSEPFTFDVGTHDLLYAYKEVTDEETETTVRLLSDRNYSYFIHNKPGFSVAGGTYDEAQNITLTNLPTTLPEGDYYPQVWYFLGDDDNDDTNDVRITSADQEIAVSESTKVSVYIVEVDSGNKKKSEVVEAEYVIRQDPGLQYMQGENPIEVVDWTMGGTNNPALPTLKNTNEVAVTYESSAPAVATVAADGTVTPVGVGTTTITASSAQTDAYTAGTASYTLNVYKDLSHSSITIEVAEVTYNGAPLEPAVTVKDGETSIAEFVSVAYANNTNAALSTAETAPTVTVTATTGAEVNYYKGSAQKTFTITAMSLETVLINDIDDQTYTGEAITPTLMVTEGDKILILDTDYTVTYTDNVNAGTATATITGMGNYQGTKSKTFTITAMSLEGATVTVDATQTYTYTGSEIKPSVTVSLSLNDEPTTLTLDTDYTVSYTNNVNAATADAETNAPTVTVTGKGNYTGSQSVKFTINPKAVTAAMIADITDQMYSGAAITPTLTVTDDGKTLALNTDYEVAYTDNVNAGTATATITGKGNYGSTASKTFTIGKATITEVTLTETSFTYNGKEQTATIASVKAGDLTLTADDYEVSGNTGTAKGTYTVIVTAKETSNFTGSKTAEFTIGVKAVTAEMIAAIADQTYTGTAITPTLTVTDDETTLTLDTDYTVAYTDNINVGTATATITGKGNYGSTASKTFTISAKALTAAMIADIADQTYTGSAITPTLTVTDGDKTLTLDTDYEVSYTNNINVASASDNLAPTVTVTGKGNYTGSQSVKFTINPKAVTAAMIADITDQMYSGAAITPTLTVTDDGKTLALNTDYEVAYTDNVNAGTATATITGKGNYGSTASKTFTISPKELTAAMVTLSAESFEYSGETQKPEVTVADGELMTADDYTIVNNGGKDVGTYEVTVTAKGNYTGEVTKQFEIVNRKLKAADVTFSENWASFYHPTENIDLPEGVAAYVLTAVGETTATATQISYIPAGVAVLLQNNVTTTTTNTSAEGNLMFHADEAVDVTTVGGTVYGLYNGKLMRVASGTIPAGKNFLVVSKPIGAPQLTITTDNTTAIEVLENAAALENSTDEWFTLDGRKLQQKPMKKGLYIKNGFKVVVNNK